MWLIFLELGVALASLLVVGSPCASRPIYARDRDDWGNPDDQRNSLSRPPAPKARWRASKPVAAFPAAPCATVPRCVR